MKRFELFSMARVVRWESRSEIHCTPSRNYKVPHLEIIRLDIILKIYIACLSCMHISYADLAWITSQINTLISNTRSYVASSPFRARQIEAIVSQLEVVVMPLLGARTKDQLLKRLTSKWGAEEDEAATKIKEEPADPSVKKTAGK